MLLRSLSASPHSAQMPFTAPSTCSIICSAVADNQVCLQADLVAGATVAVMAVPQAVSFAAMAGLPAAYGLYTAFVPVLVYCLFGSSRHLVGCPFLTS